MPGIEEVDSSMLLGEDENLSRKGSTSQGKQSVSPLAEASGSLIGDRLGREKEPHLLFDRPNALTMSIPFAPTFCREQMYSHIHEEQLFPIPILNLQRATAATNAKTLLETNILRNSQTISIQKDPG
jgi:hypothetical protein